jgi:hypothetical protein
MGLFGELLCWKVGVALWRGYIIKWREGREEERWQGEAGV